VKEKAVRACFGENNGSMPEKTANVAFAVVPNNADDLYLAEEINVNRVLHQIRLLYVDPAVIAKFTGKRHYEQRLRITSTKLLRNDYEQRQTVSI
jgi:hypothetical protein